MSIGARRDRTGNGVATRLALIVVAPFSVEDVIHAVSWADVVFQPLSAFMDCLVDGGCPFSDRLVEVWVVVWAWEEWAKQAGAASVYSYFHDEGGFSVLVCWHLVPLGVGRWVAWL